MNHDPTLAGLQCLNLPIIFLQAFFSPKNQISFIKQTKNKQVHILRIVLQSV